MRSSISLTPRFVLAKYAPDLARMEPRNIGIFLWSKGEIICKFLDEKAASTIVSAGELDVYSRWMSYWYNIIGREAIIPRRGKPVPKSTPECVEALLKTQKGNYILEDGGELVEVLRKKDHRRALDHLFKTLVAGTQRESKGSHDSGFSAQCLSLLEEAGISSRDDFQKKYPVHLNLYGETEELHFSYGFGNGHPEALIQRVQLGVEDSVVSSLLKLQTVIYGSAIIRADRLRIMYRKSDITSEHAEKAHSRLNALCESVDVESADSLASLQRLIPA